MCAFRAISAPRFVQLGMREIPRLEHRDADARRRGVLRMPRSPVDYGWCGGGASKRRQPARHFAGGLPIIATFLRVWARDARDAQS